MVLHNNVFIILVNNFHIVYFVTHLQEKEEGFSNVVCKIQRVEVLIHVVIVYDLV